jgi:hypothetical protein
LKRRVTITFNGEKVQTIVLGYTEYERNVLLRSEAARQEYERQTKQCSYRGHIDVHKIYLNVAELSRRASNSNTKGSLWYHVKEVHATMDSFLFSYVAIDNKGKKTLQETIPVINIDKLNVHYRDPNIQNSKLQGNKKIYDLDPKEIQNWR